MDKLVRWLVEQCTRATAAGRVVRLELRHLAVGNARGSEVELEQVPEQIDPAWCEATATRLHRAAATDANGIGDGAQRYVVTVHRAGAPERPTARHAMVIAAEDVQEAGSGYQSEPPTATGLVAMMMRHLESKERAFAGTMGRLITGLSDRCEALEHENEALRTGRMKTLELVEELQSMRQDRDLELKRSEAQIEAMKGLAADVKLLLPALANRLSGGKSAPRAEGQPDLKSEAVARFVASLEPEQQAKIAEVLSPAQQIALMELGVHQPNPN